MKQAEWDCRCGRTPCTGLDCGVRLPAVVEEHDPSGTWYTVAWTPHTYRTRREAEDKVRELCKDGPYGRWL